MYLDITVHYVHVFTCHRYNSLVLLLRTFIVFVVTVRWRHQHVLIRYNDYVFNAVDPSPLLLPNTSGRLAVLGMLYIMYVG